MDITRLAPSPTGALHLGNARTFLINWLLARKQHWRVVLRVEDLDGPRIKPGSEAGLLEDLRWLGLDWDQGPTRQSDRGDAYLAALSQLTDAGLAYPCVCTRKEIELAASAPHADDGSSIYPGTCRGRFATIAAARADTGREPAIRFRIPDDSSSIITWTDRFAGECTIDARTLGDFVIAKADGTAAYQLAVVVDDAAAGVTQVVRGNDLIESTPRQVLLYRALNLANQLPHYGHAPLVVGADGRRLAKRHGDSRLNYYRSQGVPPGRILALLGRWLGINDVTDHATIADLLTLFKPESLPTEPIVFTQQDDDWLKSR
ncbi:tRNA glutamyl-Q(34) synthetase GluQRS [Humisphaera borealis]|uniref:Glutamyl-Q tRNA(Asp) synthetase n=1 Tax=Humisphaera borealis TaxID=2807512 RepID=A0A7M2WRY1_9BACT|nr:tRNA glutamyl-Q(34) synthetase GluQRS [Humisphaera borealis]QOV88149.1 tRNA glutamyl-Q(34) synthetase GluQRS [Humisphaera borealis]